MLISVTHSQTSVIIRCKIRDSSVSTGAGKTGLLFSSSGMIISTIADNEASPTVYSVASSNVQAITSAPAASAESGTLGTYAAPTSSKCRFEEVNATNHKGIYELHFANARFSVSGAKSLLVSIAGASDAAECDFVVPLGLPVDSTAINNDATAAAALALFCQSQHYGTAQAGGTNTITLDAGESSVTDYWAKSAVQILSGTGAGQVNRATTYDGTTKVLTVVDNWKTQPDNTSVYMLIGRIE